MPPPQREYFHHATRNPVVHEPQPTQADPTKPNLYIELRLQAPHFYDIFKDFSLLKNPCFCDLFTTSIFPAFLLSFPPPFQAGLTSVGDGVLLTATDRRPLENTTDLRPEYSAALRPGAPAEGPRCKGLCVCLAYSSFVPPLFVVSHSHSMVFLVGPLPPLPWPLGKDFFECSKFRGRRRGPPPSPGVWTRGEGGYHRPPVPNPDSFCYFWS